jgi:hypothetical protein
VAGEISYRLAASQSARFGVVAATARRTGWLQYLLPVPVAALVAIVVYGWKDWQLLAVAALIAGGAFVAGGLIGFLFAIPRSLAGEKSGGESSNDSGYRPNTNLEQISDWLTKILVGVGLVQFTAFAHHIGDLVRFLGPGLGGAPLGESFAASILALFSITGFLAFYLFTRIYLSGEFAEADRNAIKHYVTAQIAQVEDTQRAQELSDVTALGLVNRQLDPEPGAPAISQAELDQAIATASAPVKRQCFTLAREQRRDSADKDKTRMERTIPVFAALIAADADHRFHQTHAQLGYALKDQSNPDPAAAEAELTEAIRIRDKAGDTGFLLYEFNRALARIKRYGPNPPSAIRAGIEADLTAAERSPYLRRQIANNEDVAAFCAAATTVQTPSS